MPWEDTRAGRDTRPVVAHVNTRFFAGSETFVYFYIQALRTFRPVCIATAGLPIEHIDQFPFPLDDLYSRPKPSVHPWGSLRRSIEDKALRVPAIRPWVVPHHSRFNWIGGICRTRQVQLIHAHFGPVGWDLLHVKRRLGVPLVTTFYGYDTAPVLPGEGADWPGRRQELFEEGDAFLVEGPAMREKLIALGCPPAKISIQRIAIPLPAPGALATRSPNRPPVILFAGRFVEKKGLEYALEAVRQVVEDGADLRFRIIGDGPLMPKARELIASRGMERYATLLGFVPHDVLIDELRSADVFLHPSVTAANGDNEGGAPTVILQAQALGVPVVSTYHADIPYITRPGRSALLAPERDSAALAANLEVLLAHPDLRLRFGQQGRDHVGAFHDVSREVAGLEAKYREVLRWSGQRAATSFARRRATVAP